MKQGQFHDPPRWALNFFRWYCRSDRAEELEGDLLEMNEVRNLAGKHKVIIKLLFWWDVIRCFKRYSVKKTQTPMNLSLYKSYFKIALRNAWKNKIPVAINVIGMGLALGFGITVYMLYAYNIEFDDFYKNTENTYRLHGLRTDNGREIRHEFSPLPYVELATTNAPDIEAITSFDVSNNTVKTGNDYFTEWVAYTHPNFIEFFDLPMKYGDRSAFKRNSVILTEKTAKKLYDDQYPIGQELTIYLDNNEQLKVTVGGVFDEIAANSSFAFNMLITLDDYLETTGYSANNWPTASSSAIFFKSENPSKAQEYFNSLVSIQNEKQPNWKFSRYEVIPFNDPMIAGHIVDDTPSQLRTRPEALIIFATLAILILLVATFNLANTAIALMSNRLKEIGVRKTLGSRKNQVFVQFLFEMMIVSGLALMLALTLSNIISDRFWGMFGLKFYLDDVSILNFIPVIIGFLVVTTIIAGLFPAIYAWKFEAITILSHKYSLKGIGWLQKTFTTGQFAFSIIVLVVGWTFSQHSDFLKRIDLGYNMNSLLMIPIQDQDEYLKLNDHLSAHPSIEKVTGGRHHHDRLRSRVLLNVDTGKVEIQRYAVDEAYLDAMEIDVLRGRNFLEGSEADKESAVVVNQAFVDEFMNGKDPINEVVRIENERRTIIGIAENVVYNLFSDYKPRPEVYTIAEEDSYRFLVARTNGENKDIESEVKEIWSGISDNPYLGKWQRDISIKTATRDAGNLRSIFLSLAYLGAILSLIGIFSMASLNVAKRTKEISIRKVLGASFSEILLKINRSFAWILIIALVGGVGLGAFLGDFILNMIYALHEGVPMASSIGIGLGVVLVGILFISLAVSRPVMANPCEGLRDE